MILLDFWRGLKRICLFQQYRLGARNTENPRPVFKVHSQGAKQRYRGVLTPHRTGELAIFSVFQAQVFEHVVGIKCPTFPRATASMSAPVLRGRCCVKSSPWFSATFSLPILIAACFVKKWQGCRRDRTRQGHDMSTLVQSAGTRRFELVILSYLI